MDSYETIHTTAVPNSVEAGLLHQYKDSTDRILHEMDSIHLQIQFCITITAGAVYFTWKIGQEAIQRNNPELAALAASISLVGLSSVANAVSLCMKKRGLRREFDELSEDFYSA